jgi:hypothetical protein
MTSSGADPAKYRETELVVRLTGLTKTESNSGDLCFAQGRRRVGINEERSQPSQKSKRACCRIRNTGSIILYSKATFLLFAF